MHRAERLVVDRSDEGRASRGVGVIWAFTSSAPNYLGKVRLLVESLRRHCPELRIQWVVADRRDEDLRNSPRCPDVDEVVFAEELQDEITSSWLFQHDVVELSTAIKPIAAARLLERPGCEAVFYFDPDLVVFSPLDDVLEELRRASILLTPHLLHPESTFDAVMDHELCALRHGVFNLGFLGLRRCAEARAFVEWWGERCKAFCWGDFATGTFTDQKWINFAPVFFPQTAILRSPRLNVAPWNIHQRDLSGTFDEGFRVGDEPLGFYHFTGFDSRAHHAMVEKYAPGNRSVGMLIDWYQQRSREGVESAWRFGLYCDGTPILPAHRKAYRSRPDLWAAFPDPYSTGRGEPCLLEWLRVTGPHELPELLGPPLEGTLR